ncbi:MAG: primosomal protein N' [Erysipelothrix sp.]|nr:primosomal protein N' [Erysipelothrix sp.]
MLIAKVLVEYSVFQVDQTYSYLINDIAVKPGLRVFVLFNNRKTVGIVMEVEEYAGSMEKYEEEFGFKLNPIISVVDDFVILNKELLELAYFLQEKTISPLIACLSVMLPSKLKPSSSFGKKKFTTFVEVVDSKDIKLTPLQTEAYNYIKNNQPQTQTDFNKAFNGSLLNRMEDKGLVVKFKKESRYYEQKVETKPFHKLTPDQESVYKEILATDDQVYLLHGVTGSGKTEIYLQLARQALEKGQSVLILVPEISLTPQMINHVRSRFGDKVAIYHSYLNDQEKYEQYQRVVKGEVKLVVGTRSSIFMPFDNIGFIILDEEHDGSYKQGSMPRYHARDVAIERALNHQAKVILGSATPSLESYARAAKGVYHLLELPNKIGVHQRIPYRIIDTQKALYKGQSNILTNELIAAIQERLDNNQQSVILLNRRGYTPVFTCTKCLSVKMCKDCDVAMSYHRDDNIMVCHVCGLIQKLPVTCDECGNNRFTYRGFGTQRVEVELNKLFPKAHVVRMDADQVGKKGSHERLLNEFENKGDILLGTQMIAKGLDYHRVTLVGVLSADAMLARNSYRSVEDTFNLITQVSGRGGRGQLKSELIVQSFDAKHYAIVLACQNDYIRFFNQEMQYRHLANYPPYSYLIKIVLSHHNEQLLEEKTAMVKELLNQENVWTTLGPSLMTKIKRQHRFQFILKGKDLDLMTKTLSEVNSKLTKRLASVNILIDVNPMEME